MELPPVGESLMLAQHELCSCITCSLPATVSVFQQVANRNPYKAYNHSDDGEASLLWQLDEASLLTTAFPTVSLRDTTASYPSRLPAFDGYIAALLTSVAHMLTKSGTCTQ